MLGLVLRSQHAHHSAASSRVTWALPPGPPQACLLAATPPEEPGIPLSLCSEPTGGWLFQIKVQWTHLVPVTPRPRSCNPGRCGPQMAQVHGAQGASKPSSPKNFPLQAAANWGTSQDGPPHQRVPPILQGDSLITNNQWTLTVMILRPELLTLHYILLTIFYCLT